SCRTIARPMPPPAPVTSAMRESVMSVRPLDESGRALLEVRGQAFAHLGATEADELEPEGRLEGGDRTAVPVVQRVLRPLDGGRRARGELPGDPFGLGDDVLVVD